MCEGHFLYFTQPFSLIERLDFPEVLLQRRDQILREEGSEEDPQLHWALNFLLSPTVFLDYVLRKDRYNSKIHKYYVEYEDVDSDQSEDEEKIRHEKIEAWPCSNTRAFLSFFSAIKAFKFVCVCCFFLDHS